VNADLFREFGFPGLVCGVLFWQLWANTLALRGLTTLIDRLEGILLGMGAEKARRE